MKSSSPADRSVSVVIPTRNRPGSLERLLTSLSRQSIAPQETILVDASDAPAATTNLLREFPSLSIRHIISPASVCLQRNMGIAAASGGYVLLADDDIEFQPGYIESILTYAYSHPDRGAFSGVLQEDGIIPDRRIVGPAFLIWSFIFQTTVWGDIATTTGHPPFRGILSAVTSFYARRGNTFSLSGMPLVTDTRGDIYETAIYGLGGALIRRDWLLAAPYDERLGEHGIGDNYGVSIQFPGRTPITILAGISYTHHRDPVNRLSPAAHYRRRIFALDYFMSGSMRFTFGNRLFLRWSVLGNALHFALRGPGNMAAESLSSLLRLCTGRNLYTIDHPPPADAHMLIV